MTRVRAAVTIAALAWSLTPLVAQADGGSDPRAVKVAEKVMRALGGRERWDALPGLVWSFGSSVHDTVRSSRRHTWNKHTGQHRVEGRLRTGEAFTFLHVIGDTLTGHAWINGVAVDADSARKLGKRAYAMWVNDAYWFLMPYKLQDPGVTLGYDGQVREQGRTYDKLALSFGAVGLTPGDRYWVWVDRAPHRIVRWEFQLQNTAPPPSSWTWDDWQRHAGLWFPTAHRGLAGADNATTNVFTRDVQAVQAFGDDVFCAPCIEKAAKP